MKITAELHTPEELLENAEELFNARTPRTNRAAILEAMAALEAYVTALVFPALTFNFSDPFVKWLEDRTKYKFDDRLEILVPLATGLEIDISKPPLNQYWKDYRDARDIRNSVVHRGKKAGARDARLVIDTVYKWLSFLGSTVELEFALIGLKKYIESKKLVIKNEDDAINITREYFSKTKAAHDKIDYQGSSTSHSDIDLILQFGDHKVTIETKYARSQSIDHVIKKAVTQVRRFASITGTPEAAVIVFHKGKVSPAFNKVLKYSNGEILVTVIQID